MWKVLASCIWPVASKCYNPRLSKGMVNDVTPYNPLPRGGVPKVGNPLSGKPDVELTQGTNDSLRKFYALNGVA